MASPTVTILDTTLAETGATQTVADGFINKNEPVRISLDLAAGDTVVIEGKADSSHDFNTLHTFTDETPADIYVSRIFRARRTVDGAAGDSTVYVQNTRNLGLTEHSS